MLDSTDYRRLIQALSSPALLLSKTFKGCTSFTCNEKILQAQSYTCIYDRLDEQYIECLIKNIHQTWYMKETQHKVGRRILFINNSEWDKCTTQRLKTRNPLKPKDSYFSCSKDFWRYTTNITFLSKYDWLMPSPRPLFILWEIEQFH